MRQRDETPWWWRKLPWLCTFVAVGCFAWSLDLDGWRVFVFCLGLVAFHLGQQISDLNAEASR